MNKLLTWLIMRWCKKELEKSRRNNPNNTIFEIKGTGKDYPRYLIYTETERVTRCLKEI